MLHVEDIELSIGKSKILNGISFDVSDGETVGLIGPNGSGKTTLFNALSGFLYPQKGSIEFNGRSLTHLSPYQRARLGVGRVFQNFGIFREMTVQENIVLALEARQGIWKSFFPWGRQTRENRREALKYLAEVGLEDKAKEKASSLSGGQMRLLEIIRILAFGSEIFLLDEPTAGVSPKMKKDVAALIEKLREMKKTVVIIEHDINFIQSFCDRIIVLDSGTVLLDGDPVSVRQDERLQEIYFGRDANGNGAEEKKG